MKTKTVIVAWVAVLAIWLTMWVSMLVGQERKAAIEETSDVEGLFYDKRLSTTGTHSCATCHPSANGFASRGIPLGIDGKPLALKAPGLIDARLHRTYFADGRAPTLEAQIEAVLTNPREMGNKTVEEAAKRVNLTKAKVIEGLAKTVRAIRHEETPFDRYLAGEPKAFTASQERGWQLFRGKAMCYLCHDPKNGFKDDKFHNTGIGLFRNEKGKLDVHGRREIGVGRYNVTENLKDWGAFKTPGLRNCRKTGPYMHDASLKDLEAVVEFYDLGGKGGAYSGLDPLIVPLRLSTREKQDLVNFLKEL